MNINRLTVILLMAMLPVCCLGQSKTDSKSQSNEVPKEVEARTGHKLGPGSKEPKFTIPAGVTLDDGTTEDEAVAIALWNNASLQAEMTARGIARADVIEAGLLRNPSLTLIFPFSMRILEAVANWPFEALWQRPKRVASARLEVERVEETLISRALDVVRDVRVAHAEYVAALEKAKKATEIVNERKDIAVIVNARLRAGDISELETATSILDARLAEEQATRFSQEAGVARERLRLLLGVGSEDSWFVFSVPPSAPDARVNTSNRYVNHNPGLQAASSTDGEVLNELIRQALIARPELKAGELAIEAAGARAKWERSRILSVSAIAKEYGRGTNGWEQGPGVQIELPIFNRNQGGISRAEAEIERAAKQLIASRQRVVAEVREAYLQLAQAREAYELWRTRVLPPLQEEVQLAESAFRSGEVAYLFVLETGRRLSDARLREADFHSAARRALAQLERSVGRRLIATP